MRAFLAVMVILLVLLLVFAVQNPGSTEVTFITFSSTVPLLLIILVSAVVGLLLGIAVMAPGSLRRGSRLRKLDSEIRTLEKRSYEAMRDEHEGAPEKTTGQAAVPSEPEPSAVPAPKGGTPPAKDS